MHVLRLVPAAFAACLLAPSLTVQSAWAQSATLPHCGKGSGTTASYPGGHSGYALSVA